jgi:hypothetical protein
MPKQPHESLAEKIQNEVEWTPTVAAMHDQIIRQFGEAITALAEKDPDAITNATAIIVQAGTGKGCLVLSDPALDDVIDELTRYAENGTPSPLAALMEARHPL